MAGLGRKQVAIVLVLEKTALVQPAKVLEPLSLSGRSSSSEVVAPKIQRPIPRDVDLSTQKEAKKDHEGRKQESN